MLEPCECPLRPEGGFARRAQALNTARASGPTIVVDAGGWAAGGLYDEYTEGPEADAQRTSTAAGAMAMMHYDAVAISDEELADGGALVRGILKENALPLVSANLRDRTSGALLAPAHRMVERGGVRTAIVGLTTHDLEGLKPEAAQAFIVDPPLEAARPAVADARRSGAAFVIVLSPLGEETSERLAREVEGIDLVVNAHRRSTASPHFRAGKAVVAQFDFQGRALGKAVLRPDGGVSVEDRIVLSPDIAQDPLVAAAIKKALDEIERDAAKRVLSVELFKMSQCPYAPAVETHVAELVHALGQRVEVRVTQLVHIDARGGLASLHGQGEVDEAKRQAAVFEFYPAEYFAYAAWRNKNPTDEDWLGACRRLGMSAARLRGCVLSGEAEELLKRHAYRVERLRVSGSPTLYFGGRRYEGGTSRNELFAAACASLPGGPKGVDACQGLPKCFADADCRKRGVVGECIDPGTEKAKCVEHEAIRVRMTLIEDSQAVHSSASRVVESLRVFFPGIVERKVDYRSAEGAALATKYKIERLPAYVLGKEALKEQKTDAVQEALVPTADAIVLSPYLSGAHQDITRPRSPGRADLFMAAHSTAAADLMSEYLDLAQRAEAPPTRLHSMVWRNSEGKLAAQGGLSELEAMARSTAVAVAWPEKLHEYLRSCLERVGSSYWQDALVEVGLDPQAVRRLAQSDRILALLDADAQALAEIASGGPVVLLAANQEVVPCTSRAELRHALSAVMAQAERAGDADQPMASRELEAVELLVRALDTAPESARPRIASGLRALSGQRLGDTPAEWRTWLEGRGE
jgi:hypothetical protein